MSKVVVVVEVIVVSIVIIIIWWWCQSLAPLLMDVCAVDVAVEVEFCREITR
jgi:hypothetical protein